MEKIVYFFDDRLKEIDHLYVKEMDQRWESVFKSWLQYPEEIGAVIVSPTHAEVWKGTATECPYFKRYQEEEVIIVHTHPPSQSRKYSPPSPADLVNCIDSPNPHVVVAEEGFWIYSANEALWNEWKGLNNERKAELVRVIVNNSHGVTALFVGGKLLDTIAEGLSREEINIDGYQTRLLSVVPRKDMTLPALGFQVQLRDTLPDGLHFNHDIALKGYEWDVGRLDDLNKRISDTEPGNCITSDGSLMAF